MPSKRPQTILTPSPLVSASTWPCVSGVPRGDISRRGRLPVATASMARPSTSAFITMPGPPPAGVSSTVRCLSVVKLRMSATSSDHVPAASALPARLAPSGPGNMSGKSVRTLARHILAVARRRLDHQPSGGEIDHRHRRLVERQHLAGVAVCRPHLDQIAGAEIMDGDHRTELVAGAIEHCEADQVGVIKF